METPTISEQKTQLDLGVPFAWEQAPGVPKDNAEEHDFCKAHERLAPVPPPGSGRRLQRENGTICSAKRYNYVYFDDFDDVFSDTMEEATFGSDGLSLRDLDEDGHMSPNFIMSRFLPDAIALADVSSSLIKPRAYKPRLRDGTSLVSSIKVPIRTVSCVETQSRPSSKVSGPTPFPWSMKNIFCGLASPARTRTQRGVHDPPIKRPRRCLSDGFSSEIDGGGGGGGGDDDDEKLSINGTRSPGWGLSFLDRLSIREGNPDAESKLSLKREGTRVLSDKIKPSWSLPQLKPPSEPWLMHAIESAKRRSLVMP